MPNSNLFTAPVTYYLTACKPPYNHRAMDLPPIHPEWRGWAHFYVPHRFRQAVYFLLPDWRSTSDNLLFPVNITRSWLHGLWSSANQAQRMYHSWPGRLPKPAKPGRRFG